MTNTIRQTHTPENVLHSATVTSEQVDAAFEYLKRKNANVFKPMIVLGDVRFKSIVEKFKMPEVPLKKSNKGYRAMRAKMNQKLSPLQKIIKNVKNTDLSFMAAFPTEVAIVQDS